MLVQERSSRLQGGRGAGLLHQLVCRGPQQGQQIGGSASLLLLGGLQLCRQLWRHMRQQRVEQAQVAAQRRGPVVFGQRGSQQHLHAPLPLLRVHLKHLLLLTGAAQQHRCQGCRHCCVVAVSRAALCVLQHRVQLQRLLLAVQRCLADGGVGLAVGELDGAPACIRGGQQRVLGHEVDMGWDGARRLSPPAPQPPTIAT